MKKLIEYLPAIVMIACVALAWIGVLVFVLNIVLS